MKIKVTEADRQKAREVHALFSAKPHSEHIASEFALAHIAAVVRANAVSSVLEFGAGIGTVTYLLLSVLPEAATLDCVEADELCLDSLETNLPIEMRDRLTIHRNGRAPKKRSFDLVIIDGKIGLRFDFLEVGSICFAEGNRSKARRALERSLNERGLMCRFTNYPHWSWPPSWQKSRFGLPVPSMRQRGCWVGRVERAG
jgi:Methyltransferase small domain